MQSKTLFPAIFCLLLLGACTSETKTGTDTSQSIDSTNTKASKEIEAIYQDCTVYASATMFFFKTAQGDTIQVSILNKGMEEAELSAKVPDNLVDDSKDIEGVPGANPKMVGKKFRIIYDAKGEIVEVKSAE